ncbi:hypothetical protein COO60DRAFT_1628110 [Scenedesmus sp. NREL 46B-D3]|nr:hypothetical protein COO60DRAFT_1628110 [Scenedesmus sp. NREL 46B-D3]
MALMRQMLCGLGDPVAIGRSWRSSLGKARHCQGIAAGANFCRTNATYTCCDAKCDWMAGLACTREQGARDPTCRFSDPLRSLHRTVQQLSANELPSKADLESAGALLSSINAVHYHRSFEEHKSSFHGCARLVFGQPAATDERAAATPAREPAATAADASQAAPNAQIYGLLVTGEAIANSAEFKQLLPAAELEAHAASVACHMGYALMVECGKWNAADVPRLQVVRGEPARAWLWLRGPKPNSKREFAAGALPMTVIDGSTSSCLTGELITGTKFESRTTRMGRKSIDQLTEAMHVQQDIMWSNKPVAGGVLYGRLEDLIQAASPTAIMCDKASSALAALLGGGAYSQFVQWHSTIRVIRWLQRHLQYVQAGKCLQLQAQEPAVLAVHLGATAENVAAGGPILMYFNKTLEPPVVLKGQHRELAAGGGGGSYRKQVPPRDASFSKGDSTQAAEALLHRSYNLLCNTALHRIWLLQLFLLARYCSASVFQAYVCGNHLQKPRPMQSVNKHPLHTKPGDKVMILSPILKPFATGTIMLVKDCDDCAGASVPRAPSWGFCMVYCGNWAEKSSSSCACAMSHLQRGAFEPSETAWPGFPNTLDGVWPAPFITQ